MTPILHTHIDARLGLMNQQNSILTLGRVYRRAYRAFAVLWPPLDASGRAGGLRRAVPRWAAPCTSARDHQGGFRVVGSGSRARARAGGDRALIIRIDVVEPIGRGLAQLDGNQHGMATSGDAQGDFMCGREVVSIARLGRAFRVVGVVEE